MEFLIGGLVAVVILGVFLAASYKSNSSEKEGLVLDGKFSREQLEQMKKKGAKFFRFSGGMYGVTYPGEQAYPNRVEVKDISDFEWMLIWTLVLHDDLYSDSEFWGDGGLMPEEYWAEESCVIEEPVSQSETETVLDLPVPTEVEDTGI